MSMSEKKLDKIFSEAMEESNYERSKEILEARETAIAAINDYLETVERWYFAWGYSHAKKSSQNPLRK